MAFVPKTQLGHFAPNALSPETPDFNNLYYIKAGYGGYNPCIKVEYIPGHIAPSGSIFSNCVGYAAGRFMEIGGITDAGSNSPLVYDGDRVVIMSKSSGKYSVGQIPQVGAIAGWVYNNGRGGHVAVVEKVESNGDIIISHSGYYGSRNPSYDAVHPYGQGGGFIFHVDKLLASNNYDLSSAWGSGWSATLQGFVYNPMNGGAPAGATLGSSGATSGGIIIGGSTSAGTTIDPSKNFSVLITSTVSQVSSYSEIEFRKLANLESNTPLSSAFILYCLSKIAPNEEDKLIKFSTSCSSLIQKSLDAGLGTWYSYDENEDVYVGDIICLGDNSAHRGELGYIDSLGIATKYKNDTITYSGAGYTDIYSGKKITTDNPKYYGIYRPNYPATEIYMQYAPASGYGNLNSSIAMLYDSHSTRKDATMLQVGSINPVTAKPLINIDGNTKLSVINYTSALGALIAAYYSNGIFGNDLSYMQTYVGTTLKAGVKYKFVDPVRFDGQHSAYLDTCGSIIYTYFANLGYPPASICGMMSAFWAEDHFDYTNQENPDASDEGNGWGLGNWTNHSGRRSAMVEFARARGKNWKNDIYVQLEYIYWELTNRPRFRDLNAYLLAPNKYDTYLGTNVNTSQVAYAVGARFSTSYVGGSYWDLHLINGVPNMTIQEVEDSYRRIYASVTPSGYDIIYTHVESGVWMFEHNLVPVAEEIPDRSDGNIEDLEY